VPKNTQERKGNKALTAILAGSFARKHQTRGRKTMVNERGNGSSVRGVHSVSRQTRKRRVGPGLLRRNGNGGPHRGSSHFNND